MPVRICDRCLTYFVAGIVPEADIDSEHCRNCHAPLRRVPARELYDHLRGVKEQHTRTVRPD